MKEDCVIYPLGLNGHITIDALRQFGQPCVRWRTPTATLYGMFSAGDAITSITDCYELSNEMVEAAIRYEVMRRCKHGRQRIKQLSVTVPRDEYEREHVTQTPADPPQP